MNFFCLRHCNSSNNFPIVDWCFLCCQYAVTCEIAQSAQPAPRLRFPETWEILCFPFSVTYMFPFQTFPRLNVIFLMLLSMLSKCLYSDLIKSELSNCLGFGVFVNGPDTETNSSQTSYPLVIIIWPMKLHYGHLYRKKSMFNDNNASIL